MDGEKQPLSKKKRIMMILCAILFVILLLLVSVIIWVNHLLNQMGDLPEQTLSPEQIASIMNATDPTDPSDEQTSPTIDPAAVTMPTEPAETIPVGEEVINILLVGQDMSGGNSRSLADSTILCTIDRVDKTLTMTSFMRDMYVRIPGYYDWKLNVAYMLGGAETLNETLEYNFGVRGDHTVVVNFAGFEKIVDLVGGLDIELTQKEADYLNRRGNWDANDETAGTWNLVEGVNHMTGIQTLAYSRIRAIGSDFSRTSRQRYVLTLLVEKAKGLNVTQFYNLLNEVLPLLYTDMDNSEVLNYVAMVLPVLKDMEIISQRIPADGTYTSESIKGPGSCIVPNLDLNRQILSDTIGS